MRAGLIKMPLFVLGIPAIVAFYDQNGQLVTTMNNPRAMPGAPFRLMSPAPIMFNQANNNSQQQGQPLVVLEELAFYQLYQDFELFLCQVY